MGTLRKTRRDVCCERPYTPLLENNLILVAKVCDVKLNRDVVALEHFTSLGKLKGEYD